jgi:hypothetical protein
LQLKELCCFAADYPVTPTFEIADCNMTSSYICEVNEFGYIIIQTIRFININQTRTSSTPKELQQECMEIFQVTTGIKKNDADVFSTTKLFLAEIDQLLTMTTYSAKIKVRKF